MKKIKTSPWIENIPKYVPGRSKDEIAKAYGVENPIKMASNENPLGPSPAALDAMLEFREKTNLYPDPMANELREAAVSLFRCPMEHIIAGNGSDEIIDLVCRAYLEPGDEVIIPQITFSYYEIASLACGANVVITPMRGFSIDTDAIRKNLSNRTKIVFIANPNNPTGLYIGKEDLLTLIQDIPPSAIIVIDEAYAAFARAEDFLSGMTLIPDDPRIIVITTLSKSHGLAGLRIGFGIARDSTLESMYKVKPPFNVNILAQKAGAAALYDEKFLKDTLTHTWNSLDYFYTEFEKFGLEYVPSQTNFVLVRIGKKAKAVYEDLLKKGIIVRYMQGSGLKEYIRVSVGLSHENATFINALEELIR